MITILRCAGLMTAIAVCLAAFSPLNGLAWLAFIDIPTATFVALGTLSILLIALDHSDWRDAFAVVFGGRSTQRSQSLCAARVWLRTAGRGAIATGGIWLLILLVQSCNGPGAPQTRACIAIGLLGPLYGTAVATFIFWPLSIACERRAIALAD